MSKILYLLFFFFSSRRRHTRWTGDWSSDVCSSDLVRDVAVGEPEDQHGRDDGEGAPPGPVRHRLRKPPQVDVDERGKKDEPGHRSEERRVGREGRGGWSA